MSWFDVLFGKQLASHEEEEQRVGTIAAIPMLGLDALGSAAYGPEAALTLLLPLGVLGLSYILPITLLIVFLLFVVYLSYRQTIAAYPTGGGSYTVARRNLGVKFGLLAAAALLLDYVLVVAIGISAGVGALVSAFPSFQPYTLTLCLAILGLIAFVNLRGVRESGMAFILPTYLFVTMMFVVIAIGIVKTLASGGHPTAVAPTPHLHATLGTASLWLLIHSFSSGCTAMTGVEAISNGVMAFQEPRVVKAQRTLTAVIIILTVLLIGIAFLVRAYGIGATEPGSKGYESVLSQLVAAVIGRGFFYYVTIGAILSVLALSANTGFADFPRLCHIIAQGGYLPYSFASRGRRLVYSQGIYVLTALAAFLLILFGGVTDRLIPLFAVGAFLAFTLSQAGMVVHWWRLKGKSAWLNMTINGAGALATGVTLFVVLIAKFTEGAWVTLFLIPAMLSVFAAVRRHYHSVALEVSCPRPLDVSDLRDPVVIVPIREWNKMAHKALRFALKLSPDIFGVQIRAAERMDDLNSQWKQFVEDPVSRAGLPVPHLVVLESPYRRTLNPLVDYVLEMRDRYPDRQIAVLIPELVEFRWYHYLLHNQRAQVLKALLLLKGGQRVIVIAVPWHLSA
ncbi:MAG TPA: APC family permease [Acidobacteriota bacterium]|nr:APC family permease [Acidobacteriota bacterium]